MQCPRCQQENRSGAKFCDECGAPFQHPFDSTRPVPSYPGVQRSLTEAIEQQTAASEILRVISSSPSDIQPVFDAIAQSAGRLCGGDFSVALRYDGELLHRGSEAHATAEGLQAIQRLFPLRPSRAFVTARAVLDRAVVHVPDVQADPEMDQPVAAALRNRSAVAVPMLLDGHPLGSIGVGRFEARPFTAGQVALLQTLAHQAVIAIENVRLFNETKEALERQTATSEILRVISSSPTDVQTVFDVIAERALHLCEGAFSVVSRYDGESLHLAAHALARPEGVETMRQFFPMRPSRINLSGRAILQGTVVHVVDVRQDEDYNQAFSGTLGSRSSVAVPMLRDGQPAGVIFVGRLEVRPFTDKQIALLQTFADQAVIAIENVRLFRELEARNRDLAEALAQQTATAEILRVISSSPTEVQPVFDAIVRSASRLCGGEHAIVTRYGELLHLAAQHNPRPRAAEETETLFPQRPRRDTSLSARALVDARAVHVPDVEREELEPSVREAYRRMSLQALIAVPMVHEGRPIGVVSVSRGTPGPFSSRQVALLKTFADQAVIATENVRLFRELESRTQELTRSVGELTALGEVGRALSSTLDLETVLQTIVLRANELAGTAGCTIWEYDEADEEFRLRASHYADEGDAALLQTPGRVMTIPKGQGVTTRVMERRQPVQIHDITAARDYESPIRRPLVEAGHRALLGVPLLSEDEVIGVLAVTRKTPGEFQPETVRLLSTLATQSALAIQNARLFREIAEKSRQLEVASQHKSEFLANMSHELRTPLNAIIGFSEVLTDRMFGDLNEKQEEYLKDIYASGTHLLSLINDILDLSKIEAGRMELELTNFDLPTAIDNALMLIRKRAGRRSITLQRYVDERLGEARADERKIRQVVLNLLSNAIKFTPEGGQIEVHAVPRDGSIEVSVTDTGVGIAPEDREAVFEEFRQVGTAEKKAEGTGLGLTLCRKFIELHGGRIWVKSQVGVGSTFTFTIPVRRGE